MWYGPYGIGCLLFTHYSPTHIPVHTEHNGIQRAQTNIHTHIHNHPSPSVPTYSHTHITRALTNTHTHTYTQPSLFISTHIQSYSHYASPHKHTYTHIYRTIPLHQYNERKALIVLYSPRHSLKVHTTHIHNHTVQ